MGNFLSLLGVENKKLWKRISTKIMILILVAIIIGIVGLEKMADNMVQKANEEGNKTSQSQTVDWKEQLKAENIRLQESIDKAEESKTFREKISIDVNKKRIAENKYRIEHNLKPAEDGTMDFWKVMTIIDVWELVALFAIIACTALIAGEFSEKTMKTMITRPYARWQILTAKLVSILIYALVLTVASYIASIISVALFYSSRGFDKSVLLWMGGKIVNVPGFLASLVNFGLSYLSVLVYVIFTFAICTISRSRALSTGLAIFLMFGGSLTSLLAYYFSWGKYIFFADTNFSYFVNYGAPFYGITLSLALIICAVYCVVFIVAGYLSFIKRDIP